MPTKKDFQFSFHPFQEKKNIHGKEMTFVLKKIRICAVIKITKASNTKLISFSNIILSQEKNQQSPFFICKIPYLQWKK